jgi:hypothetical protein
VIAGTATSVSNRVSRRQGQRWAQQEYEQAPPPPPAQPVATPPPAASGAATYDRIEALQKLGELKAQGVLSEAEFAAEKAKILAS